MGLYNQKQCTALRKALNVSTASLASDIYSLYTKQHPEEPLSDTDAFVETGYIRSVIDDFEKAYTLGGIQAVKERGTNKRYSVLDNIVPVLFDIRRKKIKEYGDWYYEFTLMAYRMEMVHANEYDAKKQKDMYEKLRTWVKANELKPWERIVHDALGDISLFSSDTKEGSTDD